MSAAPDPVRTGAALVGVSETALLTLNARAAEARRPDAIVDDPMAITLAESIDFDFAKFGRTRQDFALRALTFDIHTRRYLNDHPAATVWRWPRACRPASGAWTLLSPTVNSVG